MPRSFSKDFDLEDILWHFDYNKNIKRGSSKWDYNFLTLKGQVLAAYVENTKTVLKTRDLEIEGYL